jgi:hypothetical protein
MTQLLQGICCVSYHTCFSICLQGLVDSWAELSPAEQHQAFYAALVAVEEGAWGQLEARLRIALQTALQLNE